MFSGHGVVRLDFEDAGSVDVDISQPMCFPAVFSDHPFQEETTALQHIVRSGDIVFDIGANFGWTTCVLSKLVESTGKIVVFEPSPPALDLLMLNIKHRSRVFLYPIALGRDCGRAEMNVTTSADGSTLSREIAHLSWTPVKSLAEVEVRTLDSLELPIPDLIVCDVEGWEMEVFAGATRTLQQGPMIMFEFIPNYGRIRGFSLTDLCGFLLSNLPMGSRIYQLDIRNYLALPTRYAERIEHSGFTLLSLPLKASS
jgi:FkbM family methyltransferase